MGGCKADADEPEDDTSSLSDTNTSTDTNADDTGHNHTAHDITANPDQTGDTGSGTLCDQYCATAAEVCMGANSIYSDEAACQTACASMRPGTQGQTTGDTVECRRFHLDLGRVDPITHCPHASEGGGGMCVFANEDLCRRYCGAVSENCTGINEAFPDPEACLDSCFTIIKAGTDGDTEGDSVNCRLTHALAAASQPAANCPLATVADNPVCKPTLCERYCTEAAQVCVGDNRLYDYESECLQACALFPTDGQEGDNAGNTVQCRLYHLGVAQIDPAFHCPHAGVSGAGVCVD